MLPLALLLGTLATAPTTPAEAIDVDDTTSMPRASAFTGLVPRRQPWGDLALQQVGWLHFLSRFDAQVGVDTNPYRQPSSTKTTHPSLFAAVMPAARVWVQPDAGTHLGAGGHARLATFGGLSSTTGGNAWRDADSHWAPLQGEGGVDGGLRIRFDHWLLLKLWGEANVGMGAPPLVDTSLGLQLPSTLTTADPLTSRWWNSKVQAALEFDFFLLFSLRYVGVFSDGHVQAAHPAPFGDGAFNNAGWSRLNVLRRNAHHVDGRLGLGMIRLDELDFGPLHIFAAGEVWWGDFLSSSSGAFGTVWTGVDGRFAPYHLDARVGVNAYGVVTARVRLSCERRQFCVEGGVTRDMLFFPLPITSTTQSSSDWLAHHLHLGLRSALGPFVVATGFDVGALQAPQPDVSFIGLDASFATASASVGVAVGPLEHVIRLQAQTFQMMSTVRLDDAVTQAMVLWEVRVRRPGGAPQVNVDNAYDRGRNAAVP